MEKPKLKVVKVRDRAKLPTKATAGSAAFDLYSIRDQVVLPYTRVAIPLGLRMAIPVGMYGRIAGRSGLAISQGVLIGGGVIDSDYRKECAAIVFVMASTPFEIKTGDRIAQLILEKIGDADVEECTELDETERTGGFGSTGT